MGCLDILKILIIEDDHFTYFSAVILGHSARGFGFRISLPALCPGAKMQMEVGIQDQPRRVVHKKLRGVQDNKSRLYFEHYNRSRLQLYSLITNSF